tara:strand:+ start:1462 stop:1920 length:459 start_codon:yes stop_codon:yes gene_type:complete
MLRLRTLVRLSVSVHCVSIEIFRVLPILLDQMGIVKNALALQLIPIFDLTLDLPVIHLAAERILRGAIIPSSGILVIETTGRDASLRSVRELQNQIALKESTISDHLVAGKVYDLRTELLCHSTLAHNVSPLEVGVEDCVGDQADHPEIAVH